MFKNLLSLMLIGLILNLTFCSTVRADSIPEKEIALALKVKTTVTKLGASREVRVKVKLRDKTKITGYISEVREDSFVVTNEMTNDASIIPYPAVKQISGRNNLSGKVVIGVGIVIALLVIFALQGA